MLEKNLCSPTLIQKALTNPCLETASRSLTRHDKGAHTSLCSTATSTPSGIRQISLNHFFKLTKKFEVHSSFKLFIFARRSK